MFKLARVQDIILNKFHPKYKGESDIGNILYTLINEPPPSNLNDLQSAKPLNTNIAHYPIPQEIILLFPGPHPNYIENKQIIDYYLSPHSLYKDPNLNAMPDAIRGDFNYPKGLYFPELEYIRPLKPFEGDIILEGRFGNSIRFGSTVPTLIDDEVMWSSQRKQDIGSPIICIRNGQNPSSDPEIPNFEHTNEDINLDDSSIYLCSNQQFIKFQPASTHNLSYLLKKNNKKYDEPEINNTSLPENPKEDVILSPASPLPPKDIQILNELSTYKQTDSSYYDISPTEQQTINPSSDLVIPPSYNVPDNVTTNYLLTNIE